MDCSLVYITVPTKTEAEKIGAQLVQLKLAACVNILENMTSMYRWKGKIVSDSEAILFAKTKTSLVPELTEVVKKHHSAKCPCVISLPIKDGNEDFFQWIHEETQ